MKTKKALARSVLVMAANGGMPDSFWNTDTRIALACDTLGWSIYEARKWAFGNKRWSPKNEVLA